METMTETMDEATWERVLGLDLDDDLNAAYAVTSFPSLGCSRPWSGHTRRAIGHTYWGPCPGVGKENVGRGGGGEGGVALPCSIRPDKAQIRWEGPLVAFYRSKNTRKQGKSGTKAQPRAIVRNQSKRGHGVAG